jgi:hypothetical protein
MAHGTWKTTGGGGFDLSDLFYAGVAFGVLAGVTVIVIELMWAIVAAAVVATAVWLWLHHRRTVAITALAAAGARMREEQQSRDAAALAEKRRHEIEVARAGATVIQNIIDPAAILAAAFRADVPQPVQVIRGEVER